MKFNFQYFRWFVLLFLVEVGIERFTHDAFIRPFVGDFLVVILIYCFIKSFLNTPLYPTAITVLLFSWLIEWLQYYHWVDLLGLSHSRFASIILGTHFSWIDLLMYTLGILLVVFIEKTKTNCSNTKSQKPNSFSI